MEQELDEIKVGYLEAYEADQAPTLDELVLRHPQYRDDLVDFVMTFLELENVARRATDPPKSTGGSTGGQGAASVRKFFGAKTLPEMRAQNGMTQGELAAAVHVPAGFIVKVERGRLIPESDDPAYVRFLDLLGGVLQRTVDEAREILRVTFENPRVQVAAGHARASSDPGTAIRQVRPAEPLEFRALLEDCQDLTPEQRREWLS